MKGTLPCGIFYTKGGSDALVGYSNADWAGDADDHKSTSGYIFMLSAGAISWRSKKQQCVCLSTAETEYIAMASAAQESVWLRQLIAELTDSLEASLLIYEEYQLAFSMIKHPQFHGHTKHIDIKHHYIREQVAEGIRILSN